LGVVGIVLSELDPYGNNSGDPTGDGLTGEADPAGDAEVALKLGAAGEADPAGDAEVALKLGAFGEADPIGDAEVGLKVGTIIDDEISLMMGPTGDAGLVVDTAWFCILVLEDEFVDEPESKSLGATPSSPCSFGL